MGRPRYGLNPRGRGVRYGFARKDPTGVAETSTMRSNYEPRAWHGHRLREELSTRTANTAAHSPLAATPEVTVPVVLIMMLIAGLSCLLFVVFVFWRFWPDLRNYLNTSMNISGFRPISEPQYVIFSPPPKDRKRYIPKCKLPADSGARTDTFTTCSEVVTVQVIPGDGDCLFAALAHQIFRRPVGSPEHASNTAMLRAEAVAYLRARVSSFRELLLSGGGVPGRAVRQRAVRRRQDPALPGRPGEAGVLGRGGEHRRPRQPPADARRHLPRGRDHVRHQERDRRGDESCAHRIPPVQGGRRQLQPLRQRAERAARQPLVHAEISLMIAVTGLMLRQPESS
ncbi:uncharacterized protein LOC134540089 isoform X3 [Bacillus rossius redtenbacheri]|uniref:uncharacterized protein LOC134540089 isoform X3 n=1 Tax=Bacillus rossius redtenbacheri TaxID=93214 RepID=UPI002FDDDDEE